MTDNFAYLKQMYAQGRILHLPLNVMDQENVFFTLKEWMKIMGYTLDTLYLSNIGMWVNYKKPFLSNVMHLINDHSIVIMSSFPTFGIKKLALDAALG